MVTVVWGLTDERRTALETELNHLREVLPQLPGVVEAWAFGSVVTGRVHAGSDLDLLVIRETDESPVDRGIRLARELASKVPLDVFVYTPAEAAAGGRFIDDVRTRGRRLW